jgi:hypothetical protein
MKLRCHNPKDCDLISHLHEDIKSNAEMEAASSCETLAPARHTTRRCTLEDRDIYILGICLEDWRKPRRTAG